jgi:hypothetical protein
LLSACQPVSQTLKCLKKITLAESLKKNHTSRELKFFTETWLCERF